jgi:hypothetical protein
MSASEPRNPYKSPGAVSDARGKLGWLIMLVILWPIVMGAVGSILGYFAGRLLPQGVDPATWNPGVGALAGTILFVVLGLLIGIRRASALRGRLDDIHARREELRQEVERRLADGGSKTTTTGRAPDGRVP